MIDDDLPHVIMGACMEVHRSLGPGWDDFAYRAALSRELKHREIFFKTEVPVAVLYKGERIDSAAKVDFLIEKKIVVLVFATDTLTPLHKERLTSYLRHGGWASGFIINFNSPDLREGVKRVVVRPAEEKQG